MQTIVHQFPRQKKKLPVVVLFAILMHLFNNNQIVGQDAEVIMQITTIEITKGKLIRNNMWAIKVNNRNGEKYTNVSIPWSGLVKVGKLEARILDLNGKVIRKLDKKSVSERSSISSISLYEDSYVKEFTLRHNQYPYIMAYSYEEIENQFIWIDYWVPVLSPEIPTYRAELNLIIPDDYKIDFRSYAGEPSVSTLPKGRVNYNWKTSHTTPISLKEVLSPPAILYLPHVKIVPLHFSFARPGSLENWTTFGNWQSNLIGPPESLPASEREKIDKLIAGVASTREKLNILYHYLQDNTRYINVSIETGGLKPHPVSYVVNNRYGDCKALSNYFRSVLAYAGISSYYSKIMAGDGFVETDRSFPSQSFNHIILYVPVDGDTLWIDCTSDYPAGYTGTFIQGRDVLVVEKNASHFQRIPQMAPDDVEEVRVFTISSERPPSATIEIEMTLKGNKYEILRSISKSLPENDKLSIITERFLPSGLVMNDYFIDQVHRDSNYIKLNILAGSNRLFAEYGENIVTSAPPFSLPRLEEPGLRKNPLKLEYPIKQTDTVKYTLPAGYRLAGLPVDTIIESPGGRFSSSSHLDGETVLVTRQFILNAGYYSGDQYAEVHSFIRNIRNTERESAIIATKY